MVGGDGEFLDLAFVVVDQPIQPLVRGNAWDFVGQFPAKECRVAATAFVRGNQNGGRTGSPAR